MSTPLDTISFDERVVLVTGAANGLGRSHALEFAKRGAIVVLFDLSDATDLAEEIEINGGTALFVQGDVSEYVDVQHLMNTIIAQFGRIDVVINNAGIIRDNYFTNMTPQEIIDVVNVHLVGTMLVTHAAYEHMYEAGYGRIVNTTSASGLFGNRGQANYAGAKLGVVGFTKTLALEGGRSNVKVNAIAPVAYTGMTEGVFETMNIDPDMFDTQLVTNAVVYLASDGVDCTGQIIGIGGNEGAAHLNSAQIISTTGITLGGLTPEDVSMNLGSILNTESSTMPANLRDELTGTIQTLSAFGLPINATGDGMPESPHTEPAYGSTPPGDRSLPSRPRALADADLAS